MLSESGGKRKLPIVIGAPEAQAIAIELEGMTPSRPLTHDLFKNFATKFDIQLQEVNIFRLEEGIFYAKLICEHNGTKKEVDSRSSDASALAVRFKCPIFTTPEIMNSAVLLSDDKEIAKKAKPSQAHEQATGPPKKKCKKELEKQLQKGLKKEDNETGSRLK